MEQFNTNKEIKIISKGNKAIHKFYTSRLGKNRNIPYLVDSKGKLHCTNTEKCNILVSYFSLSFKNNVVKVPDQLKTGLCIKDIEFDIISISKILMRLPGKNSTSPDGIPYILLKNVIKQFLRLLLIFRIILDSGSIPEVWKTSFIIPIYKKGNKYDPSNYRPISITLLYVGYLKELLLQLLRNSYIVTIFSH